MPDVTPFALRRILTLRQFPVLCEAELGELTLFAENVTEVVLRAGTPVASAGSPLTALHLVIDGEIATLGAQRQTWGPGQVFGALEVLANREASASAVATVATTTLQLLAPDVTELLEDSFGVLLATLRGLAAGQPPDRAGAPRSSGVPVPSPSGSLGLVERLILLRQQPAFATAPLESLVALAHASADTALPRAAVVARAGTPGTASYVILEGALSALDESGAARTLGPGDAIGHLETLGGLPHTETIEVVEPVRALKVTASSLFDVIEDHTDFGRALLAVLADRLLPRR